MVVCNEDILNELEHDKLFINFALEHKEPNDFKEQDLLNDNQWNTSCSLNDIFNTDSDGNKENVLWRQLNSAVIRDVLKEYQNELSEDAQIIVLDYYSSFSKNMEFDDDLIWNNDYKRNWWLKHQKDVKGNKKLLNKEIGMRFDKIHKLQVVGHCLNVSNELWMKYIDFVQQGWLNTETVRLFIDKCKPRKSTLI